MNFWRLVRRIRPVQPTRPPAPVVLTIPVDESWTPEECGQLLDRAPGWLLEFFAADHPSLTDPGGYVWVVRPETDDPAGDTRLRKVSNHGWSSHYLRTGRAELQAELYRNRAHQGQGVVLRLGPYRIADHAR